MFNLVNQPVKLVLCIWAAMFFSSSHVTWEMTHRPIRVKTPLNVRFMGIVVLKPSFLVHFLHLPWGNGVFLQGWEVWCVCGMLLWLCPQNNTVQPCVTTIWIVSAVIALFYSTFYFIWRGKKCGYRLNMKNMALVSNIFTLYCRIVNKTQVTSLQVR